MQTKKSLAALKPKTLDGIKRLATRIKKLEGIKHTAALDIAAKQAGYENFNHARNQLGE